jgi:hypothetical protein
MFKKYLLLTAALAVAACSETSTSPNDDGLNLSPAFASVPAGYNEVIHSYAGSEGEMTFRGGPRGNAALGGGLMGGGLGELFVGANFSANMPMGPGHGPGGPGRHPGGFGFGHWPFADGRIDPSCTFNATTGRVVCPAVTRNGVTVNKSVRYTTSAGAVQQAFDSITTNTINTQISAAGTFTRVSRQRNDSSSVTVNNASDRTVSGLARGSTQNTVNGTSTGRESVAGRDSAGTYTSLRVVGDTTRNVVIPVTTTDSLRYPRSGSVTRQMTVTVTYTGKTPTTTTRREVVTYNGTATATIVITTNGTSKTCTMPLPRGRLTCPN